MKDLGKPTLCPVHLQLFRPSVIRGPWFGALTNFLKNQRFFARVHNFSETFRFAYCLTNKETILIQKVDCKIQN